VPVRTILMRKALCGGKPIHTVFARPRTRDLGSPAQVALRLARVHDADALIAGSPVRTTDLYLASHQVLEHRPQLRPHAQHILRPATHVIELGGGYINLRSIAAW